MNHVFSHFSADAFQVPDRGVTTGIKDYTIACPLPVHLKCSIQLIVMYSWIVNVYPLYSMEAAA